MRRWRRERRARRTRRGREAGAWHGRPLPCCRRRRHAAAARFGPVEDGARAAGREADLRRAARRRGRRARRRPERVRRARRREAARARRALCRCLVDVRLLDGGERADLRAVRRVLAARELDRRDDALHWAADGGAPSLRRELVLLLLVIAGLRVGGRAGGERRRRDAVRGRRGREAGRRDERHRARLRLGRAPALLLVDVVVVVACLRRVERRLARRRVRRERELAGPLAREEEVACSRGGIRLGRRLLPGVVRLGGRRWRQGTGEGVRDGVGAVGGRRVGRGTVDCGGRCAEVGLHGDDGRAAGCKG